MFTNNDKVNGPQMVSIITLTLIGVGVLNLPRRLVEEVGTDGWLVLIIGAIISSLVAFVHGYIIKSFPGKSLFDILTITLTKPIAYGATLWFWVYLVGMNGFVVRIFGEVVKMFMLPRTPIEIINISILLVAAYCSRKGIEALGRLAEILLIMSSITIVFLFSLTVEGADFTNLLPAFQFTTRDIIRAVPYVFFSFLGYEILLIFGRHLKGAKKAPWVGPIAIGIVLINYSMTNTFTLANFGTAQTEHLIWPLMSVFKTVELPGAFIENVEVLVMAVWTLTVFATIAPFYLGSAMLVSQVVKVKEHQFFVLPLLPIIYFVSLYSPSLPRVYEDLSTFSNYTGYFIVIAMPLMVVLSIFIRGLLSNNGSESI